MKLLVLNIAFREESFYKRWRLLSEKFNIPVTLVGPKYDEYKKAGPTIVFRPEPIDEGNFRVLHVNMQRRKILRNDWWDWGFIKLIIEENPDIIYLIGMESRNALFMSKIATIFMKNKPLIGLFSMRGKDIPINNREFMLRWRMGRKWYDFIHVHYPEGKKIYKEQIGFDKNISLQTQIGVDQDVYFPSSENVGMIRRKYDIRDEEFVFSAAIRIEDAKGVYEIIEACSYVKSSFKFLLMGNGKDFEKVKNLVHEKGLEDKIILTGRVESGKDVADHMNASNCFVHVPKNTSTWVDTFPLAVVQAMACGLPVIGSDSGAVPYQLGEKGLIIPESDSKSLAKKMEWVIQNSFDAEKIGNLMLDRVLNCFEIRHLNDCLYRTFKSYLEKTPDHIVKDQVECYEK